MGRIVVDICKTRDEVNGFKVFGFRVSLRWFSFLLRVTLHNTGTVYVWPLVASSRGVIVPSLMSQLGVLLRSTNLADTQNKKFLRSPAQKMIVKSV